MPPPNALRPLLLVMTLAAAADIGAAVIFRENFSYADGSLSAVARSAWSRQQGDPAIAIQERTAVLGGPGESRPGYVTRHFSTKPAGTQVSAALILQFSGPLGERKAGGTPLFQFTDPSGKSRRARLYVRAHRDGDAVELGVTSRQANGVRWSGRALPLHEDHNVLLHYDSADGTTRLWINPTPASNAPDARAQDPDVITPGRVSLQVDAWTIGLVKVRRIVVHDDPITLAPAAPPAPADLPPAPAAPPARMRPPADSARSPGTTIPPAANFHVFLLAGQSNMAGRGVVEPADRAANPRILVYDGPDHWIPAAEPLHRDKSSAGVGPGLAFARALLTQLPSDAVIGLIPAAFGGSSLATWRASYDGKDRWTDGRTYFQFALQSAQSAARTGSLRAVLWNQGESDAGRAEQDGGANYQRQLDGFVAELRTALGIPELPFIAATLGPWRAEQSRALNAVIRALPARVPRTYVVDTTSPPLSDQLRNKPDDPAHYDSPSARALGAAYAATYAEAMIHR